MTGVVFETTIPDEAVARLEALGDRLVGAEVLDILGAVVESGARRRIGEEKIDPAGEPWRAWSAQYARTRRRGQSLLQSRGDLLDSIGYEVSGGAARVGSNLVYAAIQQFGGAEVGKPGLPARPYLGVSAEDAATMTSAIAGFVERVLR